MNTTIKLRTEPLSRYRKIAKLTTDAELAKAMKVHTTTVWRTVNGKSGLTITFIEGMLNAFPALSFGDLFCIERDGVEVVDEPADPDSQVDAA